MTKKFAVIPAIDLMDACCVRLLQGKKAQKTVYSDKPAEVAKKWASEGAERLHVVDLDGAFEGSPKNIATIKSICSSIDIPVELGGGLRNFDAVAEAFDAGVSYAIIGTAVINDKELLRKFVEEYGDKIIVGIDAKNGKVAIDGWVKVSKISAFELAQDMQSIGVETIIFTDIKTDGMLKGPNLKSLKQMAEAVPKIDIIASGGISSIDDLLAVKNLGYENIIGAITGKALYEDRIILREAIEKLS